MFSNVVWDNCTQYESTELEKIQNEAARIVTGAAKLITLYKEVSSESQVLIPEEKNQSRFYIL